MSVHPCASTCRARRSSETPLLRFGIIMYYAFRIGCWLYRTNEYPSANIGRDVVRYRIWLRYGNLSMLDTTLLGATATPYAHVWSAILYTGISACLSHDTTGSNRSAHAWSATGISALLDRYLSVQDVALLLWAVPNCAGYLPTVRRMCARGIRQERRSFLYPG